MDTCRAPRRYRLLQIAERAKRHGAVIVTTRDPDCFPAPSHLLETRVGPLSGEQTDGLLRLPFRLRQASQQFRLVYREHLKYLLYVGVARFYVVLPGVMVDEVLLLATARAVVVARARRVVAMDDFAVIVLPVMALGAAGGADAWRGAVFCGQHGCAA